MQIVGGTLPGLEIWELGIVPAILNNAETWVHISKKSIDLLEDLQCMMFRYLLATPRSTPPSLLLWDLGATKMSNRIIQKKLMFFYDLLNLPDDALAKQVLIIQLKCKYPGLGKECVTLFFSNLMTFREIYKILKPI